MKNGREKRRAFRIVERVHLKYEVLTEQEFEDGLEEHRMAQGVAEGSHSRLTDLDARLTEKLYVLRSQSAVAADCLSLLNQKVNLLIEQFPALRESKTSLVRQEAQSCEVSAVGMVFSTAQELQPGTRIALRLLFVADNCYIETLATVVRQLDRPDTSSADKPFPIAVEFQRMTPEQKDVLIQHLLNRESETLRMRRLRQTQQLNPD